MDFVIKPGLYIKSFTSKSEKEIVLRYVDIDDVEQMTEFINDLSNEDTFISLSGEQFTLEEENKYIQETLDKLENGSAIKIIATHNNRIIGTADILRLFRRSSHVGRLGITINKEFRKDGVGKEMINTLLDVAKQLGYNLIQLEVFAINGHALNDTKSSGLWR